LLKNVNTQLPLSSTSSSNPENSSSSYQNTPNPEKLIKMGRKFWYEDDEFSGFKDEVDEGGRWMLTFFNKS